MALSFQIFDWHEVQELSKWFDERGWLMRVGKETSKRYKAACANAAQLTKASDKSGVYAAQYFMMAFAAAYQTSERAFRTKRSHAR